MTATGTTRATDPAVDPKISRFLMIATYLLGAIGYFVGFYALSADGAEEAVKWVCLISVGIVGVVSMVRHSVFHRSDAARMRWDLGRRNNFQLEVGYANFGIGAVAILAVVGDWGTVAQAAVTLVYALYFLQVAVLVLFDRDDAGKLDAGRFASMCFQTGLLGFFGVAALHAVGASPFG